MLSSSKNKTLTWLGLRAIQFKVGSLYLVGTFLLMVMAPSGAGMKPATGGGGGWNDMGRLLGCCMDCKARRDGGGGGGAILLNMSPGPGKGGGAGGAGGGGGGGAILMASGNGGGGGGSGGETHSTGELFSKTSLSSEPSPPPEPERGRERDKVCNSRFLLCSRDSRFFSSCSFCFRIRLSVQTSSSNFNLVAIKSSRSVLKYLTSVSISANL